MQGNVSMCTSENDLKVIYGLFNLREEREMARGSLKYILTDINDIKRSYFRLGFHLNEFKICKYYEDFGYTTFEEFCEANFDMDKGAVSRCINVFLMISAAGEVKSIGNYESRGCASQMSEKYKDYSYSQLCEMLPLDEKKRSQVKPDMTVKEIRELKNKITDISPGNVKAFVEYFHDDVVPFSRENLKQHFSKQNYLGVHNSDLSFDFKPGKVRINYSEYYSFDKILDFYEKCGGQFEEVATSQPEEAVPTYESFSDEEFIAELLMQCKLFVFRSKVDSIISSNISGKRFTFEDSEGNTYMVQYSVSKKKEG